MSHAVNSTCAPAACHHPHPQRSSNRTALAALQQPSILTSSNHTPHSIDMHQAPRSGPCTSDLSTRSRSDPTCTVECQDAIEEDDISRLHCGGLGPPRACHKVILGYLRWPSGLHVPQRCHNLRPRKRLRPSTDRHAERLKLKACASARTLIVLGRYWWLTLFCKGVEYV